MRTKINNKEAQIAIIGLGYVGLPLLIEFGGKGFKVMGFDIDPQKAKRLLAGESYLHHIPAAAIRRLLEEKRLRAFDDFEQIGDADAVIICVPTPLTKQRDPDLSFIVSSTEAVASRLKERALVVLESTTYPGTTEEVVKPILERNGRMCGKDFFLAYSPEREDPNNPNFKTKDIPKIVSGVTESCLNMANALYSQIVTTIPVSSPKVAEAAKLLENIYRSVNIAMVNEMKTILTAMDIDIWEVIAAARTKPFGFQAFYPGPGLGGHCIPIDPFYLSWKAKEFDRTARFIELAGEINTQMPYYVVEKVAKALNHFGKAIKGAKILIFGLAYKKDVGDYRESPAIKLFEILERQGASVDYHDPFVPQIKGIRANKDLDIRSVELSETLLARQDCVLIATDHSSSDYALIGRHAKLIVDTRNAMAKVGPTRAKVVKA
jgi:UDP-N-acetyl-D-glucosamine dehydrogenase